MSTINDVDTRCYLKERIVTIETIIKKKSSIEKLMYALLYSKERINASYLSFISKEKYS